MPLAAPGLQRLIGAARRAAARTAHGQLHGQYGNSHTQQEQEVEQHKYTASIFSGHIRETPYVSDADGTAGADQDKAKPGAKTFTFHFLIPPLLLFHDNVPYYDSKKREKMQR